MISPRVLTLALTSGAASAAFVPGASSGYLDSIEPAFFRGAPEEAVDDRRMAPRAPKKAPLEVRDIVADEECYAGQVRQDGDCAGFDEPIRQKFRDINLQDIVADEECPARLGDECVGFEPVLGTFAEGVDYDAPVDRQLAAGHLLVRSGEGGRLDHTPVVDDECYMGKDGRFGECVDFDPPRAAPKVALDLQGINADEECYAGQVRLGDDCVGFDEPIRQKFLDLNLQDIVPDEETKVVDEVVEEKMFDETVDFGPVREAIAKTLQAEVEVDFDAPVKRQLAVGHLVRSGEGGTLDHMPVVDDECYLGKHMEFNQCVDYDP